MSQICQPRRVLRPGAAGGMARATALILLSLLLPGLASGAEQHDFSSAPLRTVEVRGLRRTRDQVVLDMVTIKPGEQVTPAVLRATKEEILDSNLFAEVSVTVLRPVDAPRTLDMIVTVREKWTLIPLPFFTSDGSSVSGGLFLLESNLFGRNKRLMTALFGGGDGFTGFFAYMDPSIAGTPWSWRASSGTGRTDHEHQLPDGTVLRRYTRQQNSFGTGVGYRVTREIRLGLGARADVRKTTTFRPGLDEEEPASGAFLEPDLSLNYDGTRPRGVLRLGPEVGTRARLMVGDNPGDPGWELSVQAGYEVPFVSSREGRARALLSAGYGEMGPADKRGLSARDGFRTLPYQKTVADQWAGGALFLELPVINRDWGALVLSHYWEGGVFDDSAHRPQYYGGPGGGFRVFLREVAIPALGLDVAYNVVDPAVVFSFSLGARM